MTASEGPAAPAGTAWLWQAGVRVAVHPSLWSTAVTQAVRLARPGWWRRWPPLPLPDPDWMAFRLQTAYGDPHQPPRPQDVIAWLHWCRRWGSLRYPQRR